MIFELSILFFVLGCVEKMMGSLYFSATAFNDSDNIEK